MAAPQPPEQEQQQHFEKLLSSYLGLSFTIFLGFLPKNSISLVTRLQTHNKDLSFKLRRAEEQLKQLHSRRKEDSKANARVVDIFATYRHAWQQEEKSLLRQIDGGSEEIDHLRGKIDDFEKLESELSANIDDLKRDIGERDEMLNFMSMNRMPNSEIGNNYGGGDGGGSLWQQDVQYQPVEPLYNLKHFVSRRESPWKVDGDTTGVSSKLKLLEQELVNLERIDKVDLTKMPSLLRKQTKRYQALAGNIDDLCGRMQASDPCKPTLSTEFRTQRQTEFLLEAFRLQQCASETSQKLTALQAETGKSYLGNQIEEQAKLATRRSMELIKNNFKEIQRNLEIWLARIIGDLEGILARDGASRVREYYISRYPFVQ